MKKAFTMIELVFVIVVLGILAAIAVPKLAATRDDAEVASARAVIAAARTGIVTERQSRLFRGDSSYMTAAQLGGDFAGALNGVGAQGWSGMSKTVAHTTVTYSYDANTGTLSCTAGCSLMGE